MRVFEYEKNIDEMMQEPESRKMTFGGRMGEEGWRHGTSRTFSYLMQITKIRGKV